MTDSEEPYLQQLAVCQCCPIVKVSGSKTQENFLVAADQALAFHYGARYLEVSGSHMLPPFMKDVRDPEQRGFEAEYKVFVKTLCQMDLPMYIFYSLKPVGNNDELTDFLIVMKSKVIALEVKAFKLVDNPAQQNIDKFESVLIKSFDQHSVVKKHFETFLKQHGFTCTIEIPLITYTVLPNASREDHHSWISHSLITDKMKEKILYHEELQAILMSLCEEEAQLTNIQEDLMLRTLLAWFYGSYCFDEVGQQLKKDQGYSVRRELDTYSVQSKKKGPQDEVAGVFLTPAQVELIHCDEDFLVIIGNPGTGKTYCLIAKMVKLFKEAVEKWKLTGNMGGEIILFVHLSASTAEWIKNLFLAAIDSYLNENLNIVIRVSDFIKFLTIDAFLEFHFDDFQNFKLFFDDADSLGSYFHMKDKNNDWLTFKHKEQDNYLSRTTFGWFATCQKPQQWDERNMPILSFIRIQDDRIYLKAKFVYLQNALRFTGHVLQYADGKAFENPPSYPQLGLENPQYQAGSRIIGNEVTTIRVENEQIPVKIADILQEVLNQFSSNDVWILCEKAEDCEKIMANCRSQGVGCYPYEEKIGQEADCIIMVNTAGGMSGGPFHFNSATRAISRLIVIESTSSGNHGIFGSRSSCLSQGDTPYLPKKKKGNPLVKIGLSTAISSLWTRDQEDNLIGYHEFPTPGHYVYGLEECSNECVKLWGLSLCVKQLFEKLEVINSPTVKLVQLQLHFERIGEKVKYFLQQSGADDTQQPKRLGSVVDLLSAPFCGYPTFLGWLSLLLEGFEGYVKQEILRKLGCCQKQLEKHARDLAEAASNIHRILPYLDAYSKESNTQPQLWDEFPEDNYEDDDEWEDVEDEDDGEDND